MPPTNAALITDISPGGLAEELGLIIGDKIISVNSHSLEDIIDFRFAFADEEIEMLVEHADGQLEEFAFDKDYDEELGCEFASAVFDGIRVCRNNCYFCFVNMLAPKMRRSLSVKDDDYRLSFLSGNFVTLTNMRESDFERIARLHLSPLYVSVHTTNGELRAKMLRNQKAADILKDIDRLIAMGIELHTQIVLCRGLNDGRELNKTIADLAARRPSVLSAAIVPVGITKHRRDDYPLKSFDAASARKVIEQIAEQQAQFRREDGQTFVYLADEFYLASGVPLPPVKYYDGFPQIENGIGLSQSFVDDWNHAKIKAEPLVEPLKILVMCGTAIAPLMLRLAVKAEQRRNGLKVKVLPVSNEFFGGNVNVSGLLTGQDLIAAAKTTRGEPFAAVLFPGTALKQGENIFLDDVPVSDLAAQFENAAVMPVHYGDEYKRVLFSFSGGRNLPNQCRI